MKSARGETQSFSATKFDIQSRKIPVEEQK